MEIIIGDELVAIDELEGDELVARAGDSDVDIM
jgi:hypothetical protein